VVSLVQVSLPKLYMHLTSPPCVPYVQSILLISMVTRIMFDENYSSGSPSLCPSLQSRDISSPSYAQPRYKHKEPFNKQSPSLIHHTTLFDSQDEGNTTLRNVGKYSTNDAASHSRRPNPVCTTTLSLSQHNVPASLSSEQSNPQKYIKGERRCIMEMFSLSFFLSSTYFSNAPTLKFSFGS
jgi:hypothetical protein